jgi:hypothetical protein
MTQYSLILFLHVAAALGLFASLSFELLSLSYLRQASELSRFVAGSIQCLACLSLRWHPYWSCSFRASS